MTGEICMYKGSLVIEFLNSFADLDVKVLAIVKNKENLIYSNTYDSSFYDREDDGFRLFRGPVYWIELFLSDGCIYDIFYGVVTSDRFLITSIVTPVLDDFCVYILKEINEKCGNVFDFSLYLNAPTHYTFHFRMSDRYYYATNNMGTEAVFISLDGSEIRYGDRESIERYITEYEDRESIERNIIVYENWKSVEKTIKNLKNKYNATPSKKSNSADSQNINKSVQTPLFTEPSEKKKTYDSWISIIIVIVVIVLLVNKFNNKTKTDHNYDHEYYSSPAVNERPSNRNSSNNNRNSSYVSENSNSDVMKMEIYELIDENSKIDLSTTLDHQRKIARLKKIGARLNDLLGREIPFGSSEQLRRIVSFQKKQEQSFKDFFNGSDVNNSELDDFWETFYFVKNLELIYMLEKGTGTYYFANNFCKQSECSKYEKARITSFLNDTYNNIREICQAGFCSEERIKAQELIWIDLHDTIMGMIDTRNLPGRAMRKLDYSLSHIILLKSLKRVFTANAIKINSYFRMDDTSHLLISILNVQRELYRGTYSFNDLKKLNVVLSTLVMPIVYSKLNEKNYHSEKMELTGGAYDLSYRVFLVSTNRKRNGNDYDRNQTEVAKVEGKLLRAKHALFLLVSDRDIQNIAARNEFYSCSSKVCSERDFKKNGAILETVFNNLVKECKKNRCSHEALLAQENNWVAYTRDWVKLLNKSGLSSASLNHVKVLYDSDQILRLVALSE